MAANFLNSNNPKAPKFNIFTSLFRDDLGTTVDSFILKNLEIPAPLSLSSFGKDSLRVRMRTLLRFLGENAASLPWAEASEIYQLLVGRGFCSNAVLWTKGTLYPERDQDHSLALTRYRGEVHRIPPFYNDWDQPTSFLDFGQDILCFPHLETREYYVELLFRIPASSPNQGLIPGSPYSFPAPQSSTFDSPFALADMMPEALQEEARPPMASLNQVVSIEAQCEHQGVPFHGGTPQAMAWKPKQASFHKLWHGLKEIRADCKRMGFSNDSLKGKEEIVLILGQPLALSDFLAQNYNWSLDLLKKKYYAIYHFKELVDAGYEWEGNPPVEDDVKYEAYHQWKYLQVFFRPGGLSFHPPPEYSPPVDFIQQGSLSDNKHIILNNIGSPQQAMTTISLP
ncbi:hypothetical protein C8J56DRAFT_886524 [Mycena floridula]|nr:hypothetical protein C8J56DRAFT_1056880 [Mycena floridula]KAJ7591753.1 hypothetical protein C8J56DRAFT_886524 [Mycena floridula]